MLSGGLHLRTWLILTSNGIFLFGIILKLDYFKWEHSYLTPNFDPKVSLKNSQSQWILLSNRIMSRVWCLTRPVNFVLKSVGSISFDFWYKDPLIGNNRRNDVSPCFSSHLWDFEKVRISTLLTTNLPPPSSPPLATTVNVCVMSEH